MRSNRAQFASLNVKLILSIFFFLLLILIFKSTSSSSPQQNSETHITNSNTDLTTINPEAEIDQTPPQSKLQDCHSNNLVPTCTKIPPSIANTIIHYATSNITPQQTDKEISVSLRILEKKSPCNFLVFGLGHDSLMWMGLNYGGNTVFLEEDKVWIEQIQEKLPTLEAYHVEYDTKVHQADKLMEIGSSRECEIVSDPRSSKCKLALKNLPSEVYDIEWDLIMVDAPTGYIEEAPGRMSAIYTAGLLARNRENGETHVFVHDVDRKIEDKFSKTFLCEGYMTEQEGRIRHFTIPSHRTRDRSFCP